MMLWIVLKKHPQNFNEFEKYTLSSLFFQSFHFRRLKETLHTRNVQTIYGTSISNGKLAKKNTWTKAERTKKHQRSRRETQPFFVLFVFIVLCYGITLTNIETLGGKHKNRRNKKEKPRNLKLIWKNKKSRKRRIKIPYWGWCLVETVFAQRTLPVNCQW